MNDLVLSSNVNDYNEVDYLISFGMVFLSLVTSVWFDIFTFYEKLRFMFVAPSDAVSSFVSF